MDKNKTPMELVSENRINQIAHQIGMENLLKLSDMFGGDHFYIPKKDSILRPIRNEQICLEFDGTNHLELAKKYGVSVNTIRDILRKNPKQKEASIQDMSKRCNSGQIEGQMDVFHFLSKGKGDGKIPK